MKALVRRGCAVAAFLALSGQFAAAQPSGGAGDGAGAQPPTLDSIDSLLDPLSIEGGSQNTGAPQRAEPDGATTPEGAQARTDTPPQPANAADADRNAAEPAGEAGSASYDIDLDELQRKLLEQGSAPLREVEPAPPVAGQKVVLKGLDKMTGALEEAEATVGETAKLWRLEIDIKACFSRVQASQSASGSAFVQIRDTKNGGDEQVFSGWMFAASPALSAMDHPRYDVWVLSCKIS